MCTRSTVRESERRDGSGTATLDDDAAADFSDVNEGFLGGRGGAFAAEVGESFDLDLGGDSRFMSGAMSCFFALNAS